MNDIRRPIQTTARPGGRLSMEERKGVKNALQAYALTDADLTHPLIELELGCGNGLALLERAKAAPQRLFTANDVFLPGMEQLLKATQKAGVTNVRMSADDGRELLARFAPQSLDRILVPFPDPWPKNSHHKRRILQNALLDDCAKLLKPNGEFWLITDWPDYAYHGLSLLAPHKSYALAGTQVAASFCKPSAQAHALQLGPNLLSQAPSWWKETKYQEKAGIAGRGTWYICAFKK
jgi:tRNA (guanine-N7-)-methyltransferase